MKGLNIQLSFKGDPLHIEYIECGDPSAPTVVLLQGWGTTAALYTCIIDLLQPHFHVIAPDFPGFGNSTEPSFAYDTADYADFTLALLETLGIQTAHFIGHSHGGRVILELASRESTPVKMNKLVLIDSAGIIRKKSLAKRARIRTFKICKKFLMLPPVKTLFPDALQALQKAFGSADYASSSVLMRQSMVKLVNTDYKEKMPLIKNPTLLIWGDKDDATPLSDAKTMEKLIPDSGLVVIKDGNHFSFLQDIGLVSRVLYSFLK